MNAVDKQLVIDAVEECKRKAKHLYGVDLSAVSCQFNLTGKAAGYAHMQGGCVFIRINPQAVEKALQFTLNDTIPHELAHIMCFINPKFGKNHNKGWKQVCMNLGGSGATTHKLSLASSKTQRQYRYVATCGTEIFVSAVIHNRMHRKFGYGRVIRATGGRFNATHYTRQYKEISAGKVANNQPQQPPTPTHTAEQLKAMVVEWANYEQLVDLNQALKMPFMQIIKLQDRIVTVSNTKITFEIDANGARKHL